MAPFVSLGFKNAFFLAALALVPGASAESYGKCLAAELLFGTTTWKARYENICCQTPQHGAEHFGFQSEPDVRFFPRLREMQTAQGSSIAEAAGASATSTFSLSSHMVVTATGSKEWIFYDSQCHIPLFVAPRGRTFAEFEKESLAHGWPSFRDEELVTGNIEIRAGGEVVSKCALPTHLGHRFADGKGYRYCIDLICMAGHAGNNTGGTQSLASTTTGDHAGHGSGGSGGGGSGGDSMSGGTQSPTGDQLPSAAASAAAKLWTIPLLWFPLSLFRAVV